MTKSQALSALWFGTLLALVLWTALGYMGTTSPELRQEILFRHSFLIIILSLPLGGLAALLVAAVIYVLGLSPTAMQDAWITSVICTGASYFQWFHLLPWLRDRWRKRA